MQEQGQPNRHAEIDVQTRADLVGGAVEVCVDGDIHVGCGCGCGVVGDGGVGGGRALGVGVEEGAEGVVGVEPGDLGAGEGDVVVVHCAGDEGGDEEDEAEGDDGCHREHPSGALVPVS